MQVPPEAMSAALKWMGDNSLSSTALYCEEWAVHVVAAAFDALPDPAPTPGDNCGCQFSENGAMCGGWPIVNIVAGMPVCARHSPPHDFARDLNDAVRDDVSREHSAPSRQRLIETCKRATEPKATGMPDDFRALARALLDWLEAGQ